MTEEQLVSTAKTSLYRVGGSLMVSVPTVILASLEATTRQKLSDKSRFFSASIGATMDGKMIVTEIIERQKVEKAKPRRR